MLGDALTLKGDLFRMGFLSKRDVILVQGFALVVRLQRRCFCVFFQSMV
ncbi:hypothetical protein PHOSAC3_150350 [Mesotoga infera]|nr:hypothetical protein PHOSAC3_150350 [Mesotoga infera]